MEFLDWSEPALQQAVAFLLREVSGRLADLSDTLILVPTRHAGRRLREALARAAAERHGAVLIGRVDTPAVVFQPPPERHAADAFVEDLVWSRTLATLDPSDFPSLMASGLDLQDPAAVFRTARPLTRLRALLCEEGRTLSDVATSLPNPQEQERWRQWVRLEALYLERLKRTGFRDGCLERLQAADRDPPPEWKRVILLFTPDPQPLAIRTLDRWSATLDVLVCVHAPESERAAFDDWGRPRPDVWAAREVDVPESAIRLLAGPAEQAAEAAAVPAGASPDHRGGIAIGLPDRSLAPALNAALESNGLRGYDPEGRAADQTPPISLAAALLHAATDPNRDALSALFGMPDALDGCGVDPRAARIQWDRLCETHLPTGLPDVLRVLRSEAASAFPVLVPVFRVWVPALEAIGQGNPAPALRRVLADVYRDRWLTDGVPRDEQFADAARGLRDVLDRFESAAPAMDEADGAVAARLLTETLGAIRLYPERDPDAVDLLGWLELHWDDAPVLLLVGMSEGMVPETVTAHPFLPGGARDALGLRGNAARFARDAYLFTVLLRSRPPGALRILLGATDARGEPQKPSRLLMQCAPGQLPDRALRLFSDSEPPAPGAPWCRSFFWTPPPLESVPVPETLSVTALKTYLDCPFRFYLANRLGMDAPEPMPREMDALAFGIACHTAWQQFGENVGMRDCTDAGKIAEFLCGAVDAWIADRFGPDPGLAIRLQQDALRGRMTAAAAVQALDRVDGWRIEQVEVNIQLQLPGLILRGRIDRLDRHEKTDAWRALDYKTTDKATRPEDVHLRTFREGDPDWTCVAWGGKDKRWTDLQLPMYAHALRQMGHPQMVCGYFLLPRATGETGIAPWNDFDADVEASAVRCAEEIARRVLKKIYWPPSARPEYDAFKGLFPRGVEESLDPVWVADAKARAEGGAP